MVAVDLLIGNARHAGIRKRHYIQSASIQHTTPRTRTLGHIIIPSQTRPLAEISIGKQTGRDQSPQIEHQHKQSAANHNPHGSTANGRIRCCAIATNHPETG
jgi:hypothetical protein